MIQMKNIQGTGTSLEIRRIVIKIGSAVIVGKGSAMDYVALISIADSVASLKKRGVEVILVSSGAIGMGRRQFPQFSPRTIPDRQALAAVGQVGLMHTYKTLFNERGFRAAQVLLTRQDMENRQRYLNVRYTLDRLLELDVVPVVNENDTVTIDELEFGDNDELSAVVATKMDADLLVILSNVDGLYRTDPLIRGGGRKSGNHLIKADVEVTEEMIERAGAGRPNLGTGGMVTKLRAVRMAGLAGIHCVIAGGKRTGVVEEILGGQFRGTYFAPPEGRRFSSRIRWIAFGRKPLGRLVIDAGAREALVVGKKSLLAAGIEQVRGEFGRGDLVEVFGPDLVPIAKGLVNYNAGEIEAIKGQRTPQIGKILGSAPYDEVIHRDNMAVSQ